MMTYSEMYAAQIPALGAAGQERFRNSRVHVVGAGRVGTVVGIVLAASGIGYLSQDDPQRVEEDNGNSLVFCLPQDLGREKVSILAERFGSRGHFTFAPLAAPVEEACVDAYIERSDLVVCCANTVSGRLAAEEKAIRYEKPILQVAVRDGRESLGGLVSARLPENRWSACFGCYLQNNEEPGRGEGLLASVTTVLGALAASMAIALLTGVHAEIFREKNFFSIDLEGYAIEALAVEKRKGCRLCASPAAYGR